MNSSNSLLSGVALITGGASGKFCCRVLLVGSVAAEGKILLNKLQVSGEQHALLLFPTGSGG